MKLALARAIFMKADILLLDEPTNHLDVKNVAWLEEYLCSQTTVSSMIVSHDAGFLDRVCTHIIHYETRKLVTYKGNLTEFIRQCPAAKKYTELSNDELKFIFPKPGFLEGVKNKDKAIVKANNCHFTYPNTDRQIIAGASIQLSLSSRVACLGPNGAGKSTFIKLLTGEAEPDIGTVWKHPNMRYAYVAQHAFHHVEQHLEKTPNEYIRWRFQTGEDKENLTKVTAQYTEEEERLMKEKIPVPQEDGSILKLVVEKIISRRQKKSKYEYEVQWKGLSMDATTWMEREKLLKFGFEKYMNRVDEREAARAGLYARPLTQANVEKHLIDFGLDAEFGTHNRIKGLSGGQKVKLVLGSAMWQQPHIVVMDEPTNYLDRDALGALAMAVKEFDGGVLLITHNCEFADALKEETWDVPGDGKLYVTGNKWGQGKKGKGEAVEQLIADEVVDALGNVVKVKGPKKKLSRKEIKAKAKARASKLAEGQDLTTDSDWELDEYIGEAKEKKTKA
jgi:elongation factor 3